LAIPARPPVLPSSASDADEIERTITTFAQSPNGGLIITPGGPAFTHRDLIIGLAARYKLPAVYFERLFVVAGGLLSYGPDRIDMYRRAAGYVDRILKDLQQAADEVIE
jgi:putative ABC transport system substrate-binding protein